MNPIICIGNYYTDKKLRELMKVCNIFELKTPTNKQIETILCNEVTNINKLNKSYMEDIIRYIQGDLRKLQFALNILMNNETKYRIT